jgi:hypothetical protein
MYGHRCQAPRVYGVKFLMFVLTLADGLCCAWFIYPVGVQKNSEIGTSSID